MKTIYVLLMSTFFLTSLGMQAQNAKLNELGNKLAKITVQNDVNRTVNIIEPTLDIDKKATIMESILDTRETIMNLVQPENFRFFNAVKGKYTYLLMRDNKRFYIIKTKTNENGFITDVVELKNATLSDQLLDGEKIFKRRCYACHGKEGKGGIGPNLTDNYWKLVDSEESFIDVITNGKKGTMMIAYKNYLKPQEIKDVILYIKALKGKVVKSPKKPEGKLMPTLFNITE